MNDVRLKCTRYAEVENDYAKLYVKDVDDNPPLSLIQNRGPSFDSISIIDQQAKETKFYMCKIQKIEEPIKDNDWNVTPFVISYSHKEESS